MMEPAAGGKRLRPALLLLTAGALGYAGTGHHRLAAVVEFIHTATLLHDDVVDESSLRRGLPTANARFGNPASVLVGDFLYTRAFQMMVQAQDMRVMQILADATNTIAEGEVMQLLHLGNAAVDEADYLRVIRAKTAKLFEASARLGAVLAGSDAPREEQCARYGQALGTAFQIIDDVLDYDGTVDDLGKNLGDDLREGKPTLPLILAPSFAKPALSTVTRQAAAAEAHRAIETAPGAAARSIHSLRVCYNWRLSCWSATPERQSHRRSSNGKAIGV
jgi:octaprenyl-diphosphate synthase